MAVHTGASGDFTAVSGGTDILANLHCNAWSLSITHDVPEDTSFDVSNNYTTSISGLASATGSASGLMDTIKTIETVTAGAAWVNNAEFDFVGTATTSRLYTFSGQVTSFDIDVTPDGLATWSMSFEMSDEVVIA